MENTNILIVDDEIPMQRMLGRLLEQYGYTCCILASNPQEARLRLDEKEFALSYAM